MEDYIINVSQIEEMQTIRDIPGLDRIFNKAKITIIGGSRVILVRKQLNGHTEKFDEYSNADDFEAYKANVYKYLL
jgi:hypothetical protein